MMANTNAQLTLAEVYPDYRHMCKLKQTKRNFTIHGVERFNILFTFACAQTSVTEICLHLKAKFLMGYHLEHFGVDILLK